MQRTSIFRVVFFLTLAFTFVMAVLPHPPEMPLAANDKVQHMVAFATLTGLGLLAFPGRIVAIIVGLGMFGGLIEIVQAIPALNRSSDWRDLIADLFAILVSVSLLVLVTRSLRATSSGDGNPAPASVAGPATRP